MYTTVQRAEAAEAKCAEHIEAGAANQRVWLDKLRAAEARCLELIATGKYHASRAEAAEAKRAELEKLLRINREYANIRALKGDKK